MDIRKVVESRYKEIESTIVGGLRDYMKGFGYERKAFLGISGGVDSTVTAYFLVSALGKDRVVGLLMNDEVTSSQDKRDQKDVIERLGIEYHEHDISSHIKNLAEELSKGLSPEERNDEKLMNRVVGNLKARTRMQIVHYYTNVKGGAAICTGNKSEILLGYFTLFGDSAGEIAPIGDLYKTQVRIVARKLGVPDNVLLKKSSPGLIPNQTAEGDLGTEYDTIDQILHHKFDHGCSNEEIVERLAIQPHIVEMVLERVRMNEFKRRFLPPVIKIDLFI